MRWTKIAWIGGTVLALACTMPGSSGEPYTPKGNPWESPAPREGDAAAKQSASDSKETRKSGARGDAKADAKGDAKGDAKTDAKEVAGGDHAATSDDSPWMTGGTVLEQLEAARARIRKLEGDNGKLKSDNAALSAVVEQLKRENENLAQAADGGTQARARIDSEMDSLRQQLKDLEARARQLADDVLAERILRVRVERELILAKVQEAENAEGGN